MKKILIAAGVLAATTISMTMSTTPVFAQAPTAQNAMTMVPVKDQIDMELLTWTEIYDKIHKEGKTTVIIANGGTEQRGPQDVLGGHTIMGHNKGVAVAKKLGNALAAYTMPFSLASGGEAMPGGSGFSSDLFKAVNVAEIDNMVKNGFKYVFIMGDHGGGQAEMKEVAEAEDKKYAPTGVRVAYISDFYSKSHDDFDEYSYAHGIPIASHAGVPDTSELMYWEPVKGMYVRFEGPNNFKTVPFAPGTSPEAYKLRKDCAANPQGAGCQAGQRGGGGGGGQRGVAPVLTADAVIAALGQRLAQPIWMVIQGAPAGARGGGGDGEGGGVGARGARGGAAANTPPPVSNGINGDPHMSSKELGKMVVEITVNNAVAEINKDMASWSKTKTAN